MKIIKTDTPSKVATELINNKLQESRGFPILLLLSGGSWLSLYDSISADLLGEWVTVGVLDERYSKDVTVNNFAQLMQTKFYRQAKDSGVSFIDTRVNESESRDQLSERFSKMLHTWRDQYANGLAIATIGMGTDGHTAGIFSAMSESDLSSNEWVVGYEFDQSVNEHTERVTVTSHFLINEVQKAICFVVGKNKCNRLQQIINPETSVEKIPAQIWNQMIEVEVVTDC